MVTEVDQKGSDPEGKINLGMVRKEDPFADAILFKVPQVILYHYDVYTSTWVSLCQRPSFSPPDPFPLAAGKGLSGGRLLSVLQVRCVA